MADSTQSKIDKLQLGDFVRKLHYDGVSHYEISKEIKSQFNESVNGQTVYRWLRTNVEDYIAPKFQSQASKESTNDLEYIDFSQIKKIIHDPSAIAERTHNTLIASFLILTMVVENKLLAYNDTNRVPSSEIKTLKMLTEILQSFTNRPVDRSNLLSIRESLDQDSPFDEP